MPLLCRWLSLAGMTQEGRFVSMSKLLINEPPLQVLPSLAVKIGLNEALVLQQIHYLLLDPNHGKKLAEHRWIFNTVEQWIVNYFPFWSVRTMKTIFTNLAKRNLIITCQPEGSVSRRKYYRINTEEMARLSDGAKNVPSIVQDSSLLNVPKSSLPHTKTSAKTTVQRKVKGTLTSQSARLSSFSPRFPYPQSEREMHRTLERHGVEPSEDYDGRFFETFSRNGWRIRGDPIFDWIETYRARLDVTCPANYLG